MSAPTTYRQCELRRGDSVDVAWIPSNYARKGKRLRIGEDPSVWEVSAVYGGTNLTAEEMLRRREDLMRFRWVLGE